MPTDVFIRPEGGTLERALGFSSYGIGGAEIFTFLSVNKRRVPEGVLWCGEKNGRTQCVIYNNGDLTVTLREGADPYPGLVLMRFVGKIPECRADALCTRDALEAYRLLGGGVLSPANEERYVYRARTMRDGFSFGFGVKEENSLVSFAFITAKNLDSCLIGDVFTVQEFRNIGFASRCVLSAAGKSLEMNCEPFVLCEEKNKSFYKKLGFEETDHI
ncbi:MAG: GNAT family N-acetyltransferase [Clostridia bacterium]|nr:GNAT family N-acetyltransferase [Clostridia bacterium]